MTSHVNINFLSDKKINFCVSASSPACVIQGESTFIPVKVCLQLIQYTNIALYQRNTLW